MSNDINHHSDQQTTIKLNMTSDHAFKSSNGHSISEDEIIQKSLREECIKQIKLSVEAKNPSHTQSNYQDPDHKSNDIGENVFFVDGTRGAGKTVFMQTIYEQLKSEINANNQNTDMRIYPLDIIDPTKFEAPMGILVSIISQLNSEVEKHNSSRSWEQVCQERNHLEQWQDTLDKLSKGLKFYANRKQLAANIDDIINLSQGLEYSFGSLTLSYQCHRLFEQAAKILGCDAFLLIFDDVDTNFIAGWEVLETIRCQLTSPKVVSLVTGDIQLYATLVRGKQLDNYSERLIKFDEQRKTERETMLDHLEQQYLLKLLPVNKRFRLKLLKELLENEQHQIKLVNWLSNESETELQAGVRQMLIDGLALRDDNVNDLTLNMNYILQLPTRLNMQLLYRYHADCVKTKETKKQTIASFVLANALNDTMISSLFRANIDNKDLFKFDVTHLAASVFNYTLQDGDFNTGYYLRPMAPQEHLCNTAITLAANVAHTLADVAACLAYLFMGPGNVILYTKLQLTLDKAKSDNLYTEFVNYMAIGRKESLKNWACHAPSAFISMTSNTSANVAPGLIRLNVHKPRSYFIPKEYIKDKESYGYKVYDEEKDEKGLARIAAMAAMTQLIIQYRLRFISIYNLIAGIETLLPSQPAHQAHQSQPNNINIELNKVAYIHSTLGAPWLTPTELLFNNDENAQDASVDLDDLEAVKELDDSTTDWLKQWQIACSHDNIQVKPSALLMGKIWSRFYFTLESISEKHKSNLANDEADTFTNATQSNAAKIMRFNVIAFLNALLVEEHFYHQVEQPQDPEQDPKQATGKYKFNDPVYLKNSITSVNIFNSNLKKLKGKSITALKQRYPLFYTIASCPLIIPFIFAEGCEQTNPSENYLYSFFIDLARHLLKAHQSTDTDQSLTKFDEKIGINEPRSTDEIGEDYKDKIVKEMREKYGLKNLHKAYVSSVSKKRK